MLHIIRKFTVDTSYTVSDCVDPLNNYIQWNLSNPDTLETKKVC